MLRLARFSIRRPVLSLSLWAVVAVLLTLAGVGLTDKLSPTILTVPGTESSQFQEDTEEEFGASTLVPILLRGPAAELDKQGPELVKRLNVRSDTRVMSAWDVGDAGEQLRPSKDAAMIVASVARDERAMVDRYQEEIERTVDQWTSAPVTTHITGQPTLDIAMKDEVIDTTRWSLLLAAPLLFALLVLVLARPVAAAVVAALGAVTVLAGFGTMTLAANIIDVDAVAIAMASSAGLALGTAFALIIVRRHLDAREAGDTSVEAAAEAVGSTGRAVLFGGTALIISLILATLIAPTEILSSLGVGVLMCSFLGVGGAVVVMPAALVLLGDRIDLLHLRVPRPVRRTWAGLLDAGSAVQRRAIWTGAAATAVLLALAIPTTAMETGPPDVSQLPEDSQARVDFEAVKDTMGPGWPTPYNILVVAKARPITDVDMLEDLEEFQATIAKDPRVASVVGPGELRAQTKDLGKLPDSLRDSGKLLEGGAKELGKLERGLGEAASGSQQLREGLQSAASGATRLQSGSSSAGSGAGRLRQGLADARAGAAKISGGLEDALTGARALREGAGEALTGSQALSGGLTQAAKPVQAGAPIVKKMAADIAAGNATLGGLVGAAQSTTASLDRAIEALQRSGASGAEYEAALAEARAARTKSAEVQASLGEAQTKISGASGIATAFAGQVAELSGGLTRLVAGAAALEGGIAKLRRGNADLADGISRLSTGGGQLTSGLAQLRDGAGALQSGLGQLTGGAGQLAGGLASGAGPAGELAGGLGTAATKVAKFRGELPSPEDLEQLNRDSPGLFDSGYFVLAAVEGAGESQRNQAAFAINLDQGGDAGQIMVVSKEASKEDSTQELAVTLRDLGEDFAQASNAEVAVGGPAGSLADFNDETAARIWLVVWTLAAAVALLLMLALRTVVLPIVTVVFAVLTAAATFGVLQLLYATGDDPLLGGPGYLDPMSVIGIFAAIFGITTVFEVLFLGRVRERLEAGETPEAALTHGLRYSAAASTGAALAMLAALVPFAFADVVPVQQFGIGLAVVVALDALIVRPVLLPAAVAVLGPRAWWPWGVRTHAPVAPSGPTPTGPPAPSPG